MDAEAGMEAVDAAAALQQGLSEAAQRLKAEGRERVDAARLLAALARPALLQNPKRLGARLRALEKRLPPESRERLGLAALWERLAEYEREATQRLRRALALALKEACERAGLELRVVSQEEPVKLRLPPLAVELDFAAGRTTLAFARTTLATCELSAERILAARDQVLKDLERPFDPREFFERLRGAYRLALTASGAREGERVEIVQLLPFVALLAQSPRFQRNPMHETFRSYGRAHFAYDMLRLRRKGGLTQNGLRLNLGVATGISASQPGRAIYFEDEYGAGEFKLTLYFTRGEEGP